MPGPKPGALPLGDIPIPATSIILIHKYFMSRFLGYLSVQESDGIGRLRNFPHSPKRWVRFYALLAKNTYYFRQKKTLSKIEFGIFLRFLVCRRLVCSSR